MCCRTSVTYVAPLYHLNLIKQLVRNLYDYIYSMFTHEKFNAYQLAIESARIALEFIEMLPAGHSSLRDQLRRAAFSIPLNIAEGTGKTGRSDRKRYYDIARGSAMECAAIWDVIVLIDPTSAPKAMLAKAKLMSVAFCPQCALMVIS
jgi:four helix bundle protein